MKLTSLTVSDFKKIQKLLERKEKLLAQIAQVDRGLEEFESDTRSAATKGPRRQVRRGRGKLKDKIIAVLKSTGSNGIHIKDIAAKVKNKPGNIRTWFFTTGKNIKNIKRVSPAKYRWDG